MLPYTPVEGAGRTRVAVTLTPSIMAIVVRGVRGGRVEASVGRVLGHRIEDVPVGSQVKLTVTRPGDRPYISTVTARGRSPMYVDLPRSRPKPPKPVPARKGVLFVNARPRSEVLVNGRSRGKTPRKLSLTSGRYTITLKHHDGRTWKNRVRVRSGQTVKVKHRWPRR